MSKVLWVHGDCLNPEGVLFRDNPGAPAIFVFDEELLREYNLSLKRMMFLYECLLEMPVVIRKGTVADEVIKFCRQHGCAQIETVYSPSPRFEQIVQTLRKQVDSLEILEPAKFTEDRDYDLKRFSRYWKKARKSALKLS